MSTHPDPTQDTSDKIVDGDAAEPRAEHPATKEVGGPKEGDPTRYGDWTVKGRCIDF